MKFRQFFCFALAALFCHSVLAQVFTLQTSDGLEIKYNGSPLVVKEELNLHLVKPAKETVELLQFGQKDTAVLAGKSAVNNIFGEQHNIKFRREASIKADSSEVELAFMAFAPSYIDELTDSSIIYEVSLPIEPFLGSTYKIFHGRASRLIEAEGTIQANSGYIAGTTIRQIALKTKNGDNLVIDCNPKGIGSRGDYPPNNIVGLWYIRCTADSIVFSRAYSPNFFGGMSAGHLRFYEGTHEDFAIRHANAAYPYFSELLPDRQYVFGAREFGKQYVDAGVNAFSEEKQYGWLQEPVLNVSTFKPRGALYSSVNGSTDASFKMSSLRSGLHIITLVTGSAEEKVGPFSVSCNGELIKDNIIVPEKSAHTLSFPVWLEEEAVISFSGKWAVSTINDQLLLTSYEDYTFKRGFWLNNQIPEPSVLFSKNSYAKEPDYTISSSIYPLPEPGQETATELKSWELPASHAVFEDGEDWRGKANIGSMGPSNNGTFLEFDTAEKIERRIRELKEENFDAVLINGMLSRHTYPTHMARAEQNIADVVEAGHKLNIKFLDHQDHSLLWDVESGFRVLVESMPYLQQTIDGQLSARGFCPSNPVYKKKFIDYIENHVKKTGIDGIMIDEVSFHGLNFCGCAECRKLFTTETGWQVPADECSEDLLNKESKLWRAWLRWRQKRLGDFWFALKERIHAFRPDFVIMGYSTHYGMTSTYGSLSQGGALEQSARGWDFIGTEIMTRNIYVNYRSVKSLRQAKAQFQHSMGLPIFGLVYTAVFDWDLMYFGWALNNLLGQRTWEMTGKYCPEDKINYRFFTTEKGNIDVTKAEQITKVALLYSNQSRDWPRGAAYPPDVLGFSQLLNMEQVPHVFINERGLNKKILQKYNVLFVCNAMSLSEDNLAEIRDFARSGGTVYLSNRVAASNENGDLRDQWSFADDFKMERIDRPITAEKLFIGDDFQAVFESEIPIHGVRCRPAEDSAAKVLCEFETKQGVRFPAAFEVAYGKGRMIYSPLLLGVPAQDREFGTTKKYDFVRSPNAEKAVLILLQEIVTEDNRVWQPLNVPEDIVTNIHRDKGELTIHFLNATGSKIQPGDIVPVNAPEVAYPAIKEDLKFIVKMPTLKRAYAVSPDFEGESELQAKKIGNNEFEITLPANKLHIYTLVRIQ